MSKAFHHSNNTTLADTTWALFSTLTSMIRGRFALSLVVMLAAFLLLR